MKVLVILQARSNSSRLPNKVLMPIVGKPMLLRQIERIKFSSLIDDLIIATTDDHTDNQLVKTLEENKLKIYRGSLKDVLDRYFQASKLVVSDHIVRLTGDCPLIDPEIIDKVIEKHLSSDSDYTCNTFPPTFPDGLDVEIMKVEVLHKIWEMAKLNSEREHVTLYIKNNAKNFKICNVTSKLDLSNLRWTVDEEEDFNLVEKIYTSLYSENKIFLMQDIIKFLSLHPDLLRINEHIARDEGLNKSLIND